ncbi:hypothetical protein CYFUS_000464 [Cystobacter fuscus]|uniref:Uncharacterized protein n=1 Tax=Cystobacter fuscus TaxID=43 RepID=A0A250IUY5_9BACT|nr:hypothetical protein CYFUS_000464 [Cystobacter fuscus]
MLVLNGPPTTHAFAVEGISRYFHSGKYVGQVKISQIRDVFLFSLREEELIQLGLLGRVVRDRVGAVDGVAGRGAVVQALHDAGRRAHAIPVRVEDAPDEAGGVGVVAIVAGGRGSVGRGEGEGGRADLAGGGLGVVVTIRVAEPGGEGAPARGVIGRGLYSPRPNATASNPPRIRYRGMLQASVMRLMRRKRACSSSANQMPSSPRVRPSTAWKKSAA